jgi:hypothetical protein
MMSFLDEIILDASSSDADTHTLHGARHRGAWHRLARHRLAAPSASSSDAAAFSHADSFSDALHPPGCASPAQLAKRAVAVSGAAPQRALPPSRVLDHG